MALAGGAGSVLTPSGRRGGGVSFNIGATRGGHAAGVELLAAVGTVVAAGFCFVAGRLLGSSAAPGLTGESDSCNRRLMEGFGGGGGDDLRDVWVLLRE